MAPSPELPFSDLVEYLTNGIYSDWKKYKSDILENYNSSNIEKIDEAGKQILILDIDDKTGQTISVPYSFAKTAAPKLKSLFNKANDQLEIGFQNAYPSKRKVHSYKLYLQNKIKELIKLPAVKEFSYVDNYINKVSQKILLFSNESVVDDNTGAVSSFTIKASSQAQQLAVIEVLYDELTLTNFINGSKEEFVKAFTGREVSIAIKWIAKSFNKSVNKNALFYLLKKLRSINLLDYNSKTYYKQIHHVFRGPHNEELKNLNVSNSQSTDIPIGKENIDRVIRLVQETLMQIP
jgi:hypothetical protein